LLILVYAIYRAYKGCQSFAKYTKADDRIRHWTATIAHVQLMIGILLYTQSPITGYFWKNFNLADTHMELTFYSLIHLVFMAIAIIIITIGSAWAKRKMDDRTKFKTMLLWYTIGLLIILLSIPWPFSPWAARPYLRSII